MNPKRLSVLLALLILAGLIAFLFMRAGRQSERARQLALIRTSLNSTVALLEKGCSLEYTIEETPGVVDTFRQTLRGNAFKGSQFRGVPFPVYETAFDGTKYMDRERPFEVYLTSNFQRSLSAGNYLGQNPLTELFAFLTPRQGFVTFANLTEPSQSETFAKNVRRISPDSAGNLVVEMEAIEGYKEEITFSAAHGYYPQEIRSTFGTGRYDVTVTDWFHPDPKRDLWLPLRIEGRNTVEDKPSGRYPLTITQVLAPSFHFEDALPPGSFGLPLPPGTYVQDRDLRDEGPPDSDPGTPSIAPWPAVARNHADFDLAFTDLDGKSHSLREWKGKTIVLNFWATWCGPCKEELPSLLELAEKLKADDAVVLILSQEKAAILKDICERRHLQGPFYAVPARDLPPVYQIAGEHIPTTFVIDPRGDIVLQHTGPADWSKAKVAAFLASQKS